MRLHDEAEFAHRTHSDPSAQRRLARRMRVKAWIKRSPAFRVYDRLMHSQSARVINPLAERLEVVQQGHARTLMESLARALEVANERSAVDMKQLQEALAAEIRAECMRLAAEIARGQARLEKGLADSTQRVGALADTLQPKILDLQIKLADIAVRVNPPDDFDSSGFRVSSQWNEDGLIQYLVARGQVTNRTFVEFGVGDYSEANTRFLIQKDNWGGLILDCVRDNIEKVRNSELYWRYRLKAVQAFVDADNVNRLLAAHGMSGDLGLLSIDVDGVDYWIWEAITVVSPQIVICEYNGIFGPDAAVTVPYDPVFDRTQKHYSWLYAGASLAALKELGQRKGYTLVGTSAGGNNAFFVRNDVMARGSIKPSERPFTRPMFRESRNPDGSLSYLDIADGIKLISHLEVYDVKRDRLVSIGEACGVDLASDGLAAR
jgi:hypothetical protein